MKMQPKKCWCVTLEPGGASAPNLSTSGGIAQSVQSAAAFLPSLGSSGHGYQGTVIIPQAQMDANTWRSGQFVFPYYRV